MIARTDWPASQTRRSPGRMQTRASSPTPSPVLIRIPRCAAAQLTRIGPCMTVDSPWWDMLLQGYKLGEAACAVAAMLVRLEALPLHLFPIRPGEASP